MTLNWTGSTGAVGYNVYRTQDKDAANAGTYSVDDSTTSFVDTGVVNGEVYYYVVTALSN